jgi:hypothetical protein
MGLTKVQNEMLSLAVVLKVNTANTSISNASDDLVKFSNVVYDPFSAYSAATGLYTIPTDQEGHYLWMSTCQWNSFSLAAGGTIRMGAYLNSSVYEFVDDWETNYGVAGSSEWLLKGSTMIPSLVAGNTLGVTMFQNTGSSKALNNLAQRTHFSLVRVAGS